MQRAGVLLLVSIVSFIAGTASSGLTQDSTKSSFVASKLLLLTFDALLFKALLLLFLATLLKPLLDAEVKAAAP